MLYIVLYFRLIYVLLLLYYYLYLMQLLYNSKVRLYDHLKQKLLTLQKIH